MARPKSEEKQGAILLAAIQVIANQGLSAPTAIIAKKAGVGNGTLFSYFPSKAELFNNLFRELKIEMASSILTGLPKNKSVRKQMEHMWYHWLDWEKTYPDKRKTLKHLNVSHEITPQTREFANEAMADIAGLIERSRENGPLKEAPLGYVVALMSSLADATIEFVTSDPENAEKHSKAGFDALWRIVG